VTEPLGAKRRDYWWTVVAVDPIAVPVTKLLAKMRVSPNTVTWISLLFGLAVGVAFSFGTRTWFIVGGVLFYVSFMFDCVDGKLARALQVTSARGKRLDEIADGARRLSAAIGLTRGLHVIDTDQLIWTDDHSFLLAAFFGLAAGYFMEISGSGEKVHEAPPEGSGWTATMARFRLLPNPGMPDVSAIAYVIGPITGLVCPGIVVGGVLVVLGILRVWFRLPKDPA
jgi:phosphatidylglycerophosphate synthase